jgi:hypothetical protein
MPNHTELKALIVEFNECKSGKRGWVSLTKSRATRAGISHKDLLDFGRDEELAVERHGKYGWIAKAEGRA